MKLVENNTENKNGEGGMEVIRDKVDNESESHREANLMSYF